MPSWYDGGMGMDTVRTFLCDSGDWTVELPGSDLSGWRRFRIITTVVSPSPSATGAPTDVTTFETIGCPNHAVVIQRIIDKAIADIRALKFLPPPAQAMSFMGVVTKQAFGLPVVTKPVKP